MVVHMSLLELVSSWNWIREVALQYKHADCHIVHGAHAVEMGHYTGLVMQGTDVWWKFRGSHMPQIITLAPSHKRQLDDKYGLIAAARGMASHVQSCKEVGCLLIYLHCFLLTRCACVHMLCRWS